MAYFHFVVLGSVTECICWATYSLSAATGTDVLCQPGTHRCAPVAKVPRGRSAGPVAVCCRVWLVHSCRPVVVHSTRDHVAFSAPQLEEHDRAHRPITPFSHVVTRDCRLDDICSLKRAVVQNLAPSCVRTTLNSVNSSSASKCLRGMGYVAIQPHMGLVTERSFRCWSVQRLAGQVPSPCRGATGSWHIMALSKCDGCGPSAKKNNVNASPRQRVRTPSTPNRPPTLSTP